MKYIAGICLILSIVYSCKKEYDQAPLKPLDEAAEVSIKNLKSRIKQTGSSWQYKFNGGDTNLYAYVISDEVSGNFYQQIFARDKNNDAIQINLKQSGGIYIGDYIRINLNQTYLTFANSMIYIDSVDLAKNIVKLSSGNYCEPISTTILQIQTCSTSPTHSNSLQSQLVKIDDVEFLPNSMLPTFADAIGKTTTNQTITTCDPSQNLIVRSSGRSNFASKPLPKGNGSIIGIVSQYNSNMQLQIRNYNEVNLTGPLCSSPGHTSAETVYLKKDFNDLSITSGAWASYAITNAQVDWTIGTFSTSVTPFAKISGFIGSGNTNSETWLISPELDLIKSTAPVLNFQTAAKYPGIELDVLVSSNYTVGSLSSANWTSLAPHYTLSPAPGSGGYVWTPSGTVDLSAFKYKKFRLAFKYQSSISGATTYELDDIIIKERP